MRAPPYDPDHLQSAMRRFGAFFGELQETFVERSNVLTQCALALLSRQHLLMTGPPGTAKSSLAALVLGRIIDESTGSPSLFARQFTENTVQTDLVGPIDFKTLMASGRTEHFTDEGMLGSVHAFLDEVLDGRDMLLRSTLNILNERELKHGAKTTKGRIECAFMTSNRYIAEVLDSSRETLLAFVDRISFISFIPRGFAEPASLSTVVRRHGGGFGRRAPTAFLSVQDLDVLQAGAELVYVPEEICDAIATLIALLDTQMAEARRADPKFQPTRYLSTRSAVQATTVLRAAVIFSKIFTRPDRPLVVEHDDLSTLRYVLLLNGVAPETIAGCIARETDPRERRQLDIMATEFDIFERCLARVPRVPPQAEPRRLAMDDLRRVANTARNSGDPEALTTAVDALLEATQSGASDANRAAKMLVETVGALTAQALQTGLAPTLGHDVGVSGLGQQVAELAEKLERSAGVGRPLAVWLRQRLLELIDDASCMTPVVSSETLALLAGAPSEAALTAQVEARFCATEGIARLRGQLAGQTPAAEGNTDSPWRAALGRLQDELCLLWDARLRCAAEAMLSRAADVPLAKVLEDLQPVLAQLDTDARRFEALGRDSELVRRVTGPRLEPLIGRAFTRLDGNDRDAVVDQVRRVVQALREAGLEAVIDPEHFVAWTVPALVAAEGADRGSPPAIRAREDYDQLRSLEPARGVTDTLLRVALATLPSESLPTAKPERASEAVWEVVRRLDAAQRDAVIALDLARIERSVAALEAWWSALQQGAPEESTSVALIEAVVQSGFLRTMRQDAEPLRLAAEIRQLIEALPGSTDAGKSLRGRLERLDARSTQLMVARLQAEADRAWSQSLAPKR